MVENQWKTLGCKKFKRRIENALPRLSESHLQENFGTHQAFGTVQCKLLPCSICNAFQYHQFLFNNVCIKCLQNIYIYRVRNM